MKIWLLRHGEAEPSRGADAARNLTERGRLQVHQAAARLQGQRFDRILCSPYTRARQTAAELLQQLELPEEPMIVPWLVPDEPVRSSVRQLESFSGSSLLVVAHQPLLGLMGGWLCEGSLQQGLNLGTASLACLEGDHLLAGSMRLAGLHHATL